MQDQLLRLFTQNWEHVHHTEWIRTICLNIYTVILGGAIYIISTGRAQSLFYYIVGFLMFFTIINLLIAIKIEAVIDNHAQANYRIINKLKMKRYAPIRTRQGLWNLIRFQWLFPVFYIGSLITQIVLMVLRQYCN